MTTPSPPPVSKRTAIALAAAAALACTVGLLVPRWVPLTPPRTVSAADGPVGSAVAGPTAASAGSPGGWAVVAVLALSGMTLFAWKWRTRSAVPVVGGAVEFYASLAIDSQCTVSLVRAGSRRLLLGHDLTGVKTMLELPGSLADVGPRVIGPVRVAAPVTDRVLVPGVVP